MVSRIFGRKKPAAAPAPKGPELGEVIGRSEGRQGELQKKVRRLTGQRHQRISGTVPRLLPVAFSDGVGLAARTSRARVEFSIVSCRDGSSHPCNDCRSVFVLYSRPTQIDGLNVELVKHKKQLSTTKNAAAQRNIKQRAMQVLRRKKMYEQQLSQLMATSFNMERTNFAIENAKATHEHISAMRDASKTLQHQNAAVNLDELEDMQDDFADMLADADEVQDVLGRSYDMGEDVDEADLDAELSALGDELDMDELEGLGEAEGEHAAAGGQWNPAADFGDAVPASGSAAAAPASGARPLPSVPASEGTVPSHAERPAYPSLS